jgi:hypothetical protein
VALFAFLVPIPDGDSDSWPFAGLRVAKIPRTHHSGVRSYFDVGSWRHQRMNSGNVGRLGEGQQVPLSMRSRVGILA